jgi:hypothetical protein
MLKKKKKKNMDKIKFQREQTRQFWQEQKNIIEKEPSIDKVYELFKYYNKNPQKNPTNIVPINKYIFRTMIRKMGYKNSGNMHQLNLKKTINF